MFTNCTFTGNSEIFEGGAISVSAATFTNCVFAGNKVLGYRWSDDEPLYSMGGAVYSSGGKATTFTNCTFNNNWAEFGCAIYCFGSVLMNNCIFWGSRDQISVYGSFGPPTVARYSDVQGSWPGEGNIDIDPCFVDAGRWVNGNDPNQIVEPNDPNAVWIDGNYHLKSQAGRWDPPTADWVQDDVTSPCVDAGNMNSPIGYEPFPNGGIINMGAYGGTAEASKSYFGEPLCESIVAGDINGDCRVNFEDFTLMGFHWLEDNTPAPPPPPRR